MKRPFALLISGAVTAVILLAVLAVASPASDPVAVEAAVAESGNLQTQLNDAYTLLEQRDQAYSQQLQDAYTQIENLQYQDDDDSYEDHDDGESYEGDDDDSYEDDDDDSSEGDDDYHDAETENESED